MATVVSPIFRQSRVHVLGELKAPPRTDLVLLGIVLLLLGFGILMVYSTTGVIGQERLGDSLSYVKRQVLAVAIGLVLLAAASRARIEHLQRISPWCLFLALLLLILPMIPGIGDSAGGARRWVNLAGFRFQPGELAKVSFILFLAGYLGRRERRLQTWTSGLLIPVALLMPVCALYIVKPDFGSAAVLTMVALAMAAAAGVRLSQLMLCGAVCAGMAALLVALSPYRLKRVIGFLSPWSDPSGKGYQLIQSLIAIGSGSVFGVGLGAGQQKLFYLPAAHTDFIFAVIAEELGFAGALCVISAFLVVLWRGLATAWRLADDTFCFSLAVGLTGIVVLPAMLNLGVVTGLLPTKGMVLPFIAYGGSSVISSLLAVGLLLALSREASEQRA